MKGMHRALQVCYHHSTSTYSPSGSFGESHSFRDLLHSQDCLNPCMHAQSCPTFVASWTAVHQSSLSFSISRNLLKLMSIESVMPFYHLILCCPLLLLPLIFPNIKIFSNESVLCIRWPRYWSFSFSISPSNEYSELISFRVYLFELLAVQRTLKIILQHHSSKTSVLWCLVFFIIQFSIP